MKKAIFYGSVHVFLERGEEVLLLKRKNTGFEDDKWSVIAGRIDGEEEVVSRGDQGSQGRGGY
ncbi:hypothetical protein [Paenibacillus lutrae]|uniref:hypothetical protein n=1 Tax=Paenibacillus lutrae TaxID=2078573 RepID=UPI0030842C33